MADVQQTLKRKLQKRGRKICIKHFGKEFSVLNLTKAQLTSLSAEEQMCVRAYLKHERKKQKKRKQKKQKKRTKLPIVSEVPETVEDEEENLESADSLAIVRKQQQKEDRDQRLRARLESNKQPPESAKITQKTKQQRLATTADSVVKGSVARSAVLPVDSRSRRSGNRVAPSVDDMSTAVSSADVDADEASQRKSTNRYFGLAKTSSQVGDGMSTVSSITRSAVESTIASEASKPGAIQKMLELTKSVEKMQREQMKKLKTRRQKIQLTESSLNMSLDLSSPKTPNSVGSDITDASTITSVTATSVGTTSTRNTRRKRRKRRKRRSTQRNSENLADEAEADSGDEGDATDKLLETTSPAEMDAGTPCCSFSGMTRSVSRACGQTFGKILFTCKCFLALRPLEKAEDVDHFRKRKAAKQPKAGASEQKNDQEESGEEGEQEPVEDEDEDDGNILMLKLHRTDTLVQNAYATQPFVRVHVVDCTTGRYLSRRRGDHALGVVSHTERCTVINKDPGGGQARTSQVLNVIQPHLSGRSRPLAAAPSALTLTNRKLASNSEESEASARLVQRHNHAEWDADAGELLFNEPFCTFTRRRVLFLFELLEFGANVPLNQLRRGYGCLRIAWGFLRAIARDGEVVLDKPGLTRLQLFKYHNSNRGVRGKLVQRLARSMGVRIKRGHTPEVFLQYMRSRRRYYESSLFVSFHRTARPEATRRSVRPMNAFQTERLKLRPSQRRLARAKNIDPDVSDEADTDLVQPGTNAVANEDPKGLLAPLARQRAFYEETMVPRSLCARLLGPTSTPMLEQKQTGCSALAYSPSGHLLAVAWHGGHGHHPILLYRTSVDPMTLTGQLRGHSGVVYHLSWQTSISRPRDRNADAGGIKTHGLMSASADGTALYWRIRGGVVVHHSLMRHPLGAYVYCIEPYPVLSQGVAITSAFDKQLRLWLIGAPDDDAEEDEDQMDILETYAVEVTCLGSLDQSGQHAHKHHVNCLKFDRRGRKLFTGDAGGQLLIWRVQNSNARHPSAFECLKRIAMDLTGKAIQCMALHPTKPQLLILGQGSVLRMYAIRPPYEVLQRYTGGFQCHNSRLHCCLSPDGKFVAAMSEDGHCGLWESATGMCIGPSPLRNIASFGRIASGTVVWSPTEHALAICALAPSKKHPVLIFGTSTKEFTPQDDNRTWGVAIMYRRKKDGAERVKAETSS